MQQLFLTAPRELRWDEVPPPPDPAPDEALVRPLAVATCDLDPLIVQGLYAESYPLALGHEFVAEVVAIGDEVEMAVGERVAVPYQISCGRCDFCTRGLTANCQTTEERATFGFGPAAARYGGALTDRVRVPFASHMLVRLPEGVEPEQAASVSDNVSDGFAAVKTGLKRWPGEEVLVVGGAGQSIGLYAAASAVALGAARTVYADNDAQRLEVAASLGAEPLEMSDPTPRRLGRFQVTVDTSGRPDWLACALRSTGPDGVASSPAGMIYRDTPLPVSHMYTHNCTFHTGRPHARMVMPEVLELIAAGKLRPELVTSRTCSFEEAAEALLEPQRKLVITRAPASA